MAKTFPRQKRLLKHDEFLAVFKRKRAVHGKYLSVHYQKITQDLPRLGLVVSKKCLKRAVERNRFKRVAREVFRQSALPSWNFVLRFTPKKARLKSSQKAVLRAEIQQLFERLSQQ